MRHRRGMQAEPDEDARSSNGSTTDRLRAKTGARRLRRKNAKALRIAIEQSERETTEAAQLAKLKRQQEMEVRWLKWLVIISDFDSNDGDSFSDDESDEDEAVAAASRRVDRRVLQVIRRIRSGDSAIFDKDAKVYSSSSEEDEDDAEGEPKEGKKAKFTVVVLALKKI